jgi:phosphoribosylformimino-5-aminoimidazole carboxamide ribotide isomerase
VKLYPAIDILDGNAVRLVKGDFDAKQTYERDPLTAALAFAGDGAQALHVVDLDGARTGEPVNLDHLRRIAAGSGLPVQFGGGLRSADAVERALDAGAARVILGTAALKDPAMLREALDRHGAERVMVSVDTRDGLATSAGWTETGSHAAAEVIASLVAGGVRHVISTDVDRDGMLEGPDLAWVGELAEPFAQAPAPARLIYSGGIGSLADLEGLAALSLERLDGVIVGKALYERRFTVPEAMRALAAA